MPGRHRRSHDLYVSTMLRRRHNYNPTPLDMYNGLVLICFNFFIKLNFSRINIICLADALRIKIKHVSNVH